MNPFNQTIRTALLGGLVLFIVLATSAGPAAAEGISEHPDLLYFQHDRGNSDSNDNLDGKHHDDEHDDDKHRLDLYLPQSSGQVPLLLWIHGGAWAVGSRKQEAEMARRLAERGIAVAAMSYRLSPAEWIRPEQDQGVEHPAHIRDVVRALDWALSNAQRYGYSSERVFVGGYSAGAHLSALLAVDERYLHEAGLGFEDLAGVVPVAGAYDMEAYYQTQIEELGPERARSHLFQVFGDKPGILSEVSPTEYLGSSSLPMLVVSETDTFDYTVLFENLARRIDNEDVRFLHVRNRDHRSLHAALKKAGDPALNAIVEFVTAAR